MLSPLLTQSYICSHWLFLWKREALQRQKNHSALIKPGALMYTRIQPGANFSPFSSSAGCCWERGNLSDSPSIWVKHLSAGVCPHGCLIIYAAWNRCGKKGRALLMAPWFVSHRHRRKLNCFNPQLRWKHQPLNCEWRWVVEAVWIEAIFFNWTLYASSDFTEHQSQPLSPLPKIC